jgi:hypothetical protein
MPIYFVVGKAVSTGRRGEGRPGPAADRSPSYHVPHLSVRMRANPRFGKEIGARFVGRGGRFEPLYTGEKK